MAKRITHDEFIEHARLAAMTWTNNNREDRPEVTYDQTYVVWSCKALQNSKALVATSATDGMYFEATLNGDTGEIYFDAYRKVQNITLTEGPR